MTFGEIARACGSGAFRARRLCFSGFRGDTGTVFAWTEWRLWGRV
jgi:hypothetical protein